MYVLINRDNLHAKFMWWTDSCFNQLFAFSQQLLSPYSLVALEYYIEKIQKCKNNNLVKSILKKNVLYNIVTILLDSTFSISILLRSFRISSTVSQQINDSILAYFGVYIYLFYVYLLHIDYYYICLIK